MKYYLKDNKLLKVGSLALTEKTDTYEGNGASEVKAGGDLVYYGNSHLSFGKTDLALKPHIEGIKVDGGYVRSYKDIKSIYKMLDENELFKKDVHLRFDTSTDDVNIPSINLVGDFTVSAWLVTPDRTAGGGGYYNMFMGRRGTTSGQFLSPRNPTTNNYEFILGLGDSVRDRPQWTIDNYVGLTRNFLVRRVGVKIELFIDGVSYGYGHIDSSENLRIDLLGGAYSYGYWYKGGLSDIRIYDRAVTNEEVIKIYNKEVVTENLQRQYLLDEGVNDVVIDSANAQNGTKTNCIWSGTKTQHLFIPEALKYRINGSNRFVSKGYDLSGNGNHLTQTTELNQPYLSGNIAPNERYGVKVLNGQVQKIIHNTIFFSDFEAWSLSIVVNTIGCIKGENGYILGESNRNSSFLIGLNGSTKFGFKNSSSVWLGTTLGNFSSIIGKGGVIHIIADGTGNISLYINGTLNFTLSGKNTGFVFQEFLTNQITVGNQHKGTSYYYRIQSGAMTEAQVQAEHNTLRAIYPEIPSVTIGKQTWATSNLEMVATPMGNVIPEVQLASAEEKITNIDDREFNSSVGWNLNEATISGGKLSVNTTTSQNDAATKTFSGLSINKWYKITYEVLSYSSGVIRFRVGSSGNILYLNNTVGVHVGYVYTSFAPNYGSGFNTADAATAEYDNISIQELGWADRTELYDGLIAQGMSVANATKEAAAWCYYNNDPNRGAVYGKLYNFYAAKLIQNDIDAYNVANSNNKWGWRLPTHNDFLTLQSYLTSNKVEGINTSKDLYVKGNSYDTSNGTNRYGFSFIGSTLRNSIGGFMSTNHSRLHIYDNGSTDFRIWTKYNSDVDFASTYPQMGAHIRLIKDE